MQQMTCYEKRTRDSWCRDSEIDTHGTCDALVHKRCVHCCWWLTWSQHLLQYMQPHIQNCWAGKAGLHSAMTKIPSFPPHMYERCLKFWDKTTDVRLRWTRTAFQANRQTTKTHPNFSETRHITNTSHSFYTKTRDSAIFAEISQILKGLNIRRSPLDDEQKCIPGFWRKTVSSLQPLPK